MKLYLKFGIFILFTSLIVQDIQGECGKNCGKGVNEKDIDTILRQHNAIREGILNGSVPGQPKGINLKLLKWDASLSKKAQNWAEKCLFAHNKNEDKRWYSVGQNLAMSWSTEFKLESDWTDPISSWYGEYKNYNYGDSWSSNTGHYTQLIWAGTEYIGCGYICYDENREGYFGHTKLYVCNYGPGGNMKHITADGNSYYEKPYKLASGDDKAGTIPEQSKTPVKTESKESLKYPWGQINNQNHYEGVKKIYKNRPLHPVSSNKFQSYSNSNPWPKEFGNFPKGTKTNAKITYQPTVWTWTFENGKPILLKTKKLPSKNFQIPIQQLNYKYFNSNKRDAEELVVEDVGKPTYGEIYDDYYDEEPSFDPLMYQAIEEVPFEPLVWDDMRTGEEVMLPS